MKYLITKLFYNILIIFFAVTQHIQNIDQISFQSNTSVYNLWLMALCNYLKVEISICLFPPLLNIKEIF